MFLYLEQFNSSDYLPTCFKTQLEIICQPVKAFKETETHGDNIIRTLEQVKTFKQRRQEEFPNYPKTAKHQYSLFEQNIKQFRAENFGIITSSTLRQSQLIKDKSSSVIELLLLKVFKNPLSLEKFSILSRKREQSYSQSASSSKPNSVRNEQKFSQTNNEFSVPVVLDKIKCFNSNATLQKKVLLEIDIRQTDNNNKPIEWKPTVLFGEGDITTSMRSNWSKALKALVKKKLVYKQLVTNRQFSSNSGNTLSIVSLTAKGRQYAKQLRNSD